MWKAVLKNRSGSNFDEVEVEAYTDEGLAEALRLKLLGEWLLADGDIITITGEDEQ